jgi:hypothetical protein
METVKFDEYMKKIDPSRVKTDNYNKTPLSHRILGKAYNI